jgi:hypothetical protein
VFYMTKKLATCIACLLVLVSTVFVAVASAEVDEIVVGLKQGDWMEYNVTVNGAVPELHDVSWCRFDIMAVDGKNVYVDVTWRFVNGGEETESHTFKLDTGQIGDCFVIPANLNEGDEFMSPEGNITISGVDEQTCAGATRSVVSANTPETLFYWDRTTGILVEANSTYPTFSIFTKADKTNIWQPNLLGLNQTVLIALVAVVAVAVVAVATFVIRKK